MPKPPALGKGLGALIPANSNAVSQQSLQPKSDGKPGDQVQQISPEKILPSSLQPRSDFPSQKLQELVESIQQHGVLQPLLVRPHPTKSGFFELIAGERRWRAARSVGLSAVPAILVNATDREALEMALIENLQREDLNPMEEAAAYARLSQEFSLTQEEIARRVGKNRATVANAMRLLELAEPVQDYVRKGLITVGHAKVILSLKNHDQQKLFAEKILREGASVRAAEKMAAVFLTSKNPTLKKTKASKSNFRSNSFLHQIEEVLRKHLSTRVVVTRNGKAGKIQIEFFDDDDLDRILRTLGINLDE